MIEGPRSRVSTTEEVSYHEAGHAVVGHRLGLELVDVDLLADREGGHGHTNFRPPDWFDRRPPLDRRGRAFAEAVVITFLAGATAEARSAGFPNPDAGGFDLDSVVTDWLRLVAPPGAVEDRLRALEATAQATVSDPGTWSAIERLAKALRDRRRLTREEALAAAGLVGDDPPGG